MECEIFMDKLMGIVLTLGAGLFFLIGGLISLKVKNKDKLNSFSVALALVIMMGLIIFDLGPEVLELVHGEVLWKKILVIGGGVFLGLFILKILDKFVPAHHHNHKEKHDNLEEHENHVSHIGTLTIISLILHNILEGFAVFGMASNNFKIGLLTSVSVALHNIPLGTHIFSAINIRKNKKWLVLLTLSSLMGGLIFLVIGSISNLVLALVSAITLGMILYIAVFELALEVWHNKRKRETGYGIILGVLILGVAMFL